MFVLFVLAGLERATGKKEFRKMKNVVAVLVGLVALLFSSAVQPAHAGMSFGPTQSSYSALTGSSFNIPFVVTLTGNTTSADLSYAAFNFQVSGDLGLSNLTWTFDPIIGGTPGPVTNSRFFSTPLALGNPTTLFGTLSGDVVGLSGTAIITPVQGAGPQWLWQGVNCPSNPELRAVSVTVVPGPGAVALIGVSGLVVAVRRRR
jgi:hypothetical protein